MKPSDTSALAGKSVAGFFVRFVLVFVVLTAPWPGLDHAYANLVRIVGNVIFVRIGSDGVARFSQPVEKTAEHQLELTLSNRRTGAAYVFPFSSRKQGYKPTVFVLALILATPVPWSRRWRSALWGLLWTNLYVLVKITVFIIAAFSGGAGLAPFTLGPISVAVLKYVHWVVVASFAGWLILPLPIWILVTLRRQDWKAIQTTTLAKARATP